MLFSKLKHKDEELLPPPPPFPSMEIEEKPKISKEIKPKKAAKDEEFEDLLEEVESLKKEKPPKVKPMPTKKEKIKKIEVKKPKLPKPSAKPLKQKITLKKIKPKLKEKKIQVKIPTIKQKPILKKTVIKQAKEPIKISSKPIIKPVKLPKKELEPEPEELTKIEPEIELPEIADLGIEDIEKEEKPIEIQAAEEEIKGAIERIKEKPSFFQRLFEKKARQAEQPVLEIDEISKIQSYISKAREALAKFDLEAAKDNYIEIMKIYNTIEPEGQAKVYNDIKELYYERKSAEGLKV